MSFMHSIINIDCPESENATAAARAWLGSCLSTIAQAQWEWIRNNGPLPSDSDGDVYGPSGGYFGDVTIARPSSEDRALIIPLAEGVESRIFDATNVTLPEYLNIDIYRLDEDGWSRKEEDEGHVITATVWGASNPERAQLIYSYSPEAEEWEATAGQQSLSARLIEPLFRSCGIADVSFACICDDPGRNIGATALDDALRRNSLKSAAEARYALRGYSWVTVLPKELASRAGGAVAMVEKNAFYAVHEFPSGALFVQATKDFTDYGGDEIDVVFRAVKRILPKGRPVRDASDAEAANRWRIVWEDAST